MVDDDDDDDDDGAAGEGPIKAFLLVRYLHVGSLKGLGRNKPTNRRILTKQRLV